MGLNDVVPRLRPPRSARSAAIRLIIGLVVAGALVYAMIAAAGGLSAATDQLREAEPGWLAPALLAEIASYVFFSLQLRCLAGPGPRVRWRVWLQVTVIVYGLGSLTPASPVEGIVFSALQLQRRGMTRRRAVLALVLGQWTQSWALVLVFAADRIVAGGLGDLSRADLAVVVVGSVALAGATVFAAALIQRRRVVEAAAGLLRFLPGQRRKSGAELRAIAAATHQDIQELTGSARNRWAVFATAMGGWMGDATCLWLALGSVHARVGLDVVLLAYTVATVVSWIPLLPAGLGAVEVAIPTVLHHFGVPLVAGLAGTLLWRVMSLVLPALAGFAAAVHLRLTGPVAARTRPDGAHPPGEPTVGADSSAGK
jgi:putative heme transporter